MSRKQKRYYYIYKTTNILNDKFYIGMHSTNDIDDGYIGSGKKLWYSINKYGKENHVCEILEYLPDRKLLKLREEEIVNKELLTQELCMNLTRGGRGGFDYVNEHGLNNSTKSKELLQKPGLIHKSRMANDKDYRNMVCDKISTTAKIAYATKKRKPVVPNWLGKSHTEETKQKIGRANTIHQEGNKNSQYGRRWITNGKLNKKINKKSPIPDGWYLGRIIR